MKRFSFLLTLVTIMLFAGCKEDEPVLIFHPQSATYTIGGTKALFVTLDGVKITEKGGSVVFETPDNKIGDFELKDIIPGYGSVTVGGIDLQEAPGGNGIIFDGEAALSETEKIVFSGSIINFVMTLDIHKVPITT